MNGDFCEVFVRVSIDEAWDMIFHHDTFAASLQMLNLVGPITVVSVAGLRQLILASDDLEFRDQLESLEGLLDGPDEQE